MAGTRSGIESGAGFREADDLMRSLEILERAEALLALKRDAEAQMWLQRSREAMEAQSLHYLRPRTERLSRRLTAR
jgi:hypothetical protein